MPPVPLTLAPKLVPPLKLRRHADSVGAKGELRSGKPLYYVSSFLAVDVLCYQLYCYYKLMLCRTLQL